MLIFPTANHLAMMAKTLVQIGAVALATMLAELLPLYVGNGSKHGLDLEICTARSQNGQR